MACHLVWTAVVIYLTYLNLGTVSAVLPGAQLRLTNAGFDYGVKLAAKELKDAVDKANIKPFHGDGHGLEYDLSSLKITDFQLGQKSLRPVANEGIRWVMGGVRVALKGAFRYSYRKLFIHISDHGTFDVSASGMSLDILVKITGFEKSGQPVLASGGCSCHISNLDLHFTGGKAKWLYNILADLARGRIKDILQKAVCEQANKAVNVDGNKALQKLKLTTPIAKKFLLNYGLVAVPTFSAGYMQLYHKGEVFWASDIREAPFSPPPIPVLPDTSQMVYVWLTEYVANTFAYAGFTHKYLHYNLSAADLPKTERHLLDTTCPAGSLDCIGAIIPQMGKRYPNSTVKLAINATQAPVARFIPEEMGVTGVGETWLYAVTPKGETHYMLHLGLNLHVTATARVNDDILYAHVDKLSLRFNVIESKIGTIHDEILDMIAKVAITYYVKPKLNAMGAKGFNLPVTGVMRFKDPKLTIVKGAIVIQSDVEYKSDKSPTKSPWMHEDENDKDFMDVNNNDKEFMVVNNNDEIHPDLL